MQAGIARVQGTRVRMTSCSSHPERTSPVQRSTVIMDPFWILHRSMRRARCTLSSQAPLNCGGNRPSAAPCTMRVARTSKLDPLESPVSAPCIRSGLASQSPARHQAGAYLPH